MLKIKIIIYKLIQQHIKKTFNQKIQYFKIIKWMKYMKNQTM